MYRRIRRAQWSDFQQEVPSWRWFETVEIGATAGTLKSVSFGRSGDSSVAAAMRSACDDLVIDEMRGLRRQGDAFRSKTPVAEEWAEVRNTQTSTPLRLLQARTAGPRIRGFRWQMRDEMRRRPDRLRLALRLSGEHLQIAVLLERGVVLRDREQPSNHRSPVTRPAAPSSVRTSSSPSKDYRFLPASQRRKDDLGRIHDLHQNALSLILSGSSNLANCSWNALCCPPIKRHRS
jgi:hypothetical protein